MGGLYTAMGVKIVRPANQLQLSDAEMKEEHTRVLTANDPNGTCSGRCRSLITDDHSWLSTGSFSSSL